MPETILTRAALNRALLARQMLLAREAGLPLRAIARLVGLQAQQPRPPFLGLWSRVENFRREQLSESLQKRKVVRATLMRATLHLMTAEDYVNLRSAIQPALTASMSSILGNRTANVDLNAVVTAAQECLSVQPRTFAELRDALRKLFPRADERAMGYLVRTTLPLITVPDGTAWGFRANAKFAEATSWLGRPLEAADDPRKLVLRYLAAFGPATPADAQTWSGLRGLKGVFESLRPDLMVFRDERNRELFDLPKAPRPAEGEAAPCRLLPAFDNILLAHQDRSRVIAGEHRPRVSTNNLQVLATFLVDGFVAGTWTSECLKGAATLTLSPFGPLPRAAKKELTGEAEAALRFLEGDATRFAVRFAG